MQVFCSEMWLNCSLLVRGMTASQTVCALRPVSTLSYRLCFVTRLETQDLVKQQKYRSRPLQCTIQAFAWATTGKPSLNPFVHLELVFARRIRWLRSPQVVRF